MLRFLCLTILAFLPHGAMAKSCDQAAENAARETGVPANILRAIARVEAGRTLHGGFAAWPWAVNQAGKGHFFETAEAAIDHVNRAMALGQSNIDIGCFQVNLHWHGAAFPNLRAMFEPDKNALYAAHFLRRLYRETGTWEAAVGAYHSRRDGAAQEYLAKVQSVLGQMDQPETAQSDVGAMHEPQVHSYPLFQGGGGALGSLFAARMGGEIRPILR